MDNADKPQLVGNRSVLAGAVLYLLEWVAIIGAAVSVPVGADTAPHSVMNAYAGHAEAFGWAAGWISVVLLGRILLVTGLRSSLRASGRPQALMDFAVGAMAIGVSIEIIAIAMPAAASWLAAHGGGVGAVRAIDATSYYVDQMLWGPTGVALLCCGLAMWRSALFPRILCWLGMVGGGLLVVVAAVLQSPRFAGLSDALTSAALLFWVWMLWTGVLLWTRTPRSVKRPVESAAA